MVLREPCISGNQIQDVIMQRMFSSPINHFLGPEFRSYAKRACLHARTHARTHRVKCSGNSPSNSQPSRLADLEGLEDTMLLEPCGVVIILATCKFREFKIRF